MFEDAECFRVILSDDPWRYDNFGQAKHGAARSAYGDESMSAEEREAETMTFEELAAIPVQRWAGEDCFLVQWATWPKLDEGMRLLEHRGFSYVTGFPWVKTVPSSGEINCGIGFWTQSTSEPVLLGRVGSTPRKADAPKVRGLLVGEEAQFYAPRAAEHSKKPLGIHEWIEQTLPGPYLELFARAPREGWTTWGHELGDHLGPEGRTPWRKKRTARTS